MNFVTSWKLSYRKFRFHCCEMDAFLLLRSRESINLVTKESLKDIDSINKGLGWENAVTPSRHHENNLFSPQLCIRLASDWRKMFCSTRDLIIPWTKFAVLKICLHLETISVEFTNNASSFAEEWRFHINNYWNVVSQVKKKSVTWKLLLPKGHIYDPKPCIH